jgi:hypothetical protein
VRIINKNSGLLILFAVYPAKIAAPALNKKMTIENTVLAISKERKSYPDTVIGKAKARINHNKPITIAIF